MIPVNLVTGFLGAGKTTLLRRLLQDPSIDVIHVCTWNASHAEITVAALEAGKHVMCEKPMAVTSGEAQQMVDAAERSGKLLTIGYQNRFRADVRHIRQRIDHGDLGVSPGPGKLLNPPDRSRPILGGLLDLAQCLQEPRRVDLAALDLQPRQLGPAQHRR